MTKMNRLNKWTEADRYSVSLGGLMDELIENFKNFSPFSKKKSLLSSRVHAWEGLDLQCLCCCCWRWRCKRMWALEWVLIYCKHNENIKEQTSASLYLPLLFSLHLGNSVFHWNPEYCCVGLFKLKQRHVPSHYSYQFENFIGHSLGISSVPGA